jgi:hypothetical protein
MIHVWDLANIVIEVAELLPEKRYILAVDDSKSTLLDIVNVYLTIIFRQLMKILEHSQS